jgi:hypothetical protein
MGLAGNDRRSIVMLDQGNPIVYLRGAGLGEQVSTYADTFWTYGSIDTAMDDVNNHVAMLKADVITHLAEIQSTPAGQQFYAQWVGFVAEWRGWYDTNRHSLSGWGRAALGGLQNAVRLYAAQYNGFEGRFTALGYTPTPVGSPHSGNVLPTEAWVGIGIGAGVLALGFVAWIVSSVSKVAAPVARAGTRGRRR